MVCEWPWLCSYARSRQHVAIGTNRASCAIDQLWAPRLTIYTAGVLLGRSLAVGRAKCQLQIRHNGVGAIECCCGSAVTTAVIASKVPVVVIQPISIAAVVFGCTVLPPMTAATTAPLLPFCIFA